MSLDVSSFKIISEGSQHYATLSLSMLAGSVAILIGTSHNSPSTTKIRLIYLALVPAWLCIMCSVYFGDLVSRGYIAAVLVKQDKLLEIFSSLNDYYYNQILLFRASITFFAIWFAFYLYWWITHPSNNVRR